MTAGLVLAAGGGRRYGRPKALVEYEGRLLVDRAVETLTLGGCSPVVVVLGAAAEEVRQRTPLVGASIVINQAWATGMGSSLRAGLAALPASGAVAVVVLLVDTPGITPAAVARLRALASPDALASATYHGQRGHPVLLGRRHWTAVAEVAHGEEGARRYLTRPGTIEVACEDVAEPADLDVPPP